MHRRSIVTLCVFLLLLPLCSPSNAGDVPTAKESLSFRSASSPVISPDGRFVAYRISQADWDDNTYRGQIHLHDRREGRSFQVTFDESSPGSLGWSPDGRWLSFTASRDGGRQLHLISPFGGEARRVSKHESGIGGYQWASDSSFLVFRSTDPLSDDEKKARKDRGKFFEVDENRRISHLWRIDVPAEPSDPVEAKRLTRGSAYSVTGFHLSPAADRIVFSASLPPKFEWRDTDIYVLDGVTALTDDAADPEPRRIVSSPGPDSGPVFSPDGKSVAYGTANGEEFFYYTNREIAVVPTSGGASRVISQEFDENANLSGWSPTGILFTGLAKTGSHLYRINPTSRNTTRLTGPDRGMWNSFSFTHDYKTMALAGGLPNGARELHVSSVEEFAPTAFTDMGQQFEKFDVATREVIEWQSQDGATIEGILYKPADYDASRKYPLLCVIHGGPTGVDRPSLSTDRAYPIERFCAKGALVLKVNYRGSAGYGAAFRKLNVRNLGVGDYWDVISGCDSLIKRGLVDGERMGCMGWSQGGYISAFVSTYCDRFKATSMGAGISNWMTYYVNTDIHPFTRQYLKATPWEDPEIYAKTSPITYVNQAKTPVLIQHGEKDQRVPIPNAYEMYQALQDRGVPVKMVVFEGYGHGVNTPKEQVALQEQNWNWFRRWIWGESDSDRVEEL